MEESTPPKANYGEYMNNLEQSSIELPTFDENEEENHATPPEVSQTNTPPEDVQIRSVS